MINNPHAASLSAANPSTSRYKAYTLQNFRELPQAQSLSPEQLHSIEVVANVFPFKTNSYVVNELINWDAVPDDPLFILNFPQRGMLSDEHFSWMEEALKGVQPKPVIRAVANKIRWQLNPHPAGQVEHNMPDLAGEPLRGMQHKYGQTVLFFPSQGQTCHAYCSFCFRWPQFVGLEGMKFAMQETDHLVQYIRRNPEVTNVLFTGGDPLIMKTKVLAEYLRPLLGRETSQLTTIRLGSKALGYWPYRFLTDPDAEELLALFAEVVQSGKNLALMAHFNHPRELQTEAVQQAISRIRQTGAQIMTQSPLLRHINDRPEVWAEMWREQVRLGCVPYYMFVVRDTGAQDYFGVPLARAWEIYRDAYQQVSGLTRTVRGPSMSTDPGKIQVLGVNRIQGERVFVMRLLQGRNPEWVGKPFFAEYDTEAIWFDQLRPAFDQSEFFFERDGVPMELATPLALGA